MNGLSRTQSFGDMLWSITTAVWPFISAAYNAVFDIGFGFAGYWGVLIQAIIIDYLVTYLTGTGASVWGQIGPSGYIQITGFHPGTQGKLQSPFLRAIISPLHLLAFVLMLHSIGRLALFYFGSYMH